MESFSIFLVEDDAALRAIVKDGLERWGYRVTAAERFDDPAAAFAASPASAVILDVNLPCRDGFAWCRSLRAITTAPVLLISARSGSMDIVMGTEAGADDYLVKPFEMEVLVAKVRGLLWRAYSYAADEGELLERDGLILNLGNGTVALRDASARLTRNEFRILRLLLKRRGRIVSRGDLMDALWSDEAYVDDNTLTVNVNRLRARLAEIGAGEVIETAKGEGYLVR